MRRSNLFIWTLSLAMFMGVAFASCSKDDDDDEKKAEDNTEQEEQKEEQKEDKQNENKEDKNESSDIFSGTWFLQESQICEDVDIYDLNKLTNGCSMIYISNVSEGMYDLTAYELKVQGNKGEWFDAGHCKLMVEGDSLFMDMSYHTYRTKLLESSAESFSYEYYNGCYGKNKYIKVSSDNVVEKEKIITIED